MDTFVTELKEGMNNNNIVKFNLLTGFVDTMSTPSTDGQVQVYVSARTKMYTSSGQFMWGDTPSGDKVTVNSTFIGYITEGGGELDIEKPHVTRITLGVKISMLLNSLMNCTELTELHVNGNAIGDIVNLSKCSSLGKLYLRNAENVDGNIENLGKLPLTALNILNTKCIGRIEDYVKQQRLLGRTTYTNVDTICFNRSVTFDGEPITAPAMMAGSFSWTTTTITWHGKTIDA